MHLNQNMIELNADNYGLYLVTYNFQYAADPAPIGKLTLEFSCPGESNIEQFVEDINIMNKIRGSYDPTVKDQFEKLLTVLALSNNNNQT